MVSAGAPRGRAGATGREGPREGKGRVGREEEGREKGVLVDLEKGTPWNS